MIEKPEDFPKLMKEPRQCILWTNPDNLPAEPKDQFEDLKILADSESPIGDVVRKLLRCRECRQLYFYELYYRSGASYRTFIPVDTSDEADRLNNCSIYELHLVVPRLQDDRLANRGVRWVTP